MTTRMLIDARHQEETRVAVLKGNRIEEFDFESAEHKQIKGNIYLAKVTRVEPSLQAAFVDYGGNRHGFLAFSEIHPDYYQIPKEDREQLLAEEAEHAAEEAALRAQEEESGDAGSDDDDDNRSFADELAEDHGMLDEKAEKALSEPKTAIRPDDDEDDDDSDGDDAENESDENEESEAASDQSNDGKGRGRSRRGKGRHRRRGKPGGKTASKASDEVRRKRMALRRRYKIQDVIHRRQVLLVQVVKEERGNKGAALSSYLSLAGRYCVLMPNSSHGGGISRKISSASDRKRLKSIISDMNLPSSMGCIVRTAGLSRTKTEIKRDFDYLARLWDEIREKTLSASAPQKIHSDSDLIKRAIRDIYNREIEEVFVEGNEGYRAAKDFMKLLMPSHARRVKQYANPTPLFQFYGAEEQLNAMYDPVVQLKSGGYLVINPTEALVSIDINSGRSTREHGIEATAVSTNLEAAREIARQLRLRDMAGLVVIDFIDMERGGNTRKVEKEMRDALKSDRARIQVGRISGFGLMEMSRQRLRTGVLEASTRVCPHCDGTGLVRTASSAGLAALRLLEEEAAKGKGNMLTLRTSQEATIYVLNNKRAGLNEIEDRYGVSIQILPNGDHEGAKMMVDVSGGKPQFREDTQGQLIAPDMDDEPEENETHHAQDSDDDASDKPKRRRRRRGRRGRKNGDAASPDNAGNDSENAASDEGNEKPQNDASEEKPKRPRRRRRKPDENAADGTVTSEEVSSEEAVKEAEAITPQDETAEEAKPKRTRRKRTPKAEAQSDAANQALTEGEAVEAQAEAKPKRTRRKAAAKTSDAGDEAVAKEKAENPEPAETEKPKRAPRKTATKTAAKTTTKTTGRAAAKTTGRTARKKAEPEAKAEQTAADAPTPAPAPAQSEDKASPETADSAPKPASEQKGGGRKGWWQRTFGN